MAKIKVLDSTFYHNGPTLSIREAAFSTYYRALSRTEVVLYTDIGKVCVDEFQYLEDCKKEYSYIDHSRPEGALHVEFCNEGDCMDLDYYKDLEVIRCDFHDNESGPLLSPEVGKYNAAAAIVVDGGLDHLINQCKFYGHKGNYDYHTSLRADSFEEYMPPGYFKLAMVPVIRIVINPDDPRVDIPF